MKPHRSPALLADQGPAHNSLRSDTCTSSPLPCSGARLALRHWVRSKSNCNDNSNCNGDGDGDDSGSGSGSGNGNGNGNGSGNVNVNVNVNVSVEGQGKDDPGSGRSNSLFSGHSASPASVATLTLRQ